MKCLRCGKIVSDVEKICPVCGFDLEAQKNYKKIAVEVDGDVDDKHKIILIDNPILTFIFGLLALMLALTIAVDPGLTFFFILLFVLTFSLCFFFSTKPCRVKLKPVRTFGLVMGYIGLGLTLYRLILFLLNFVGLFE